MGVRHHASGGELVRNKNRHGFCFQGIHVLTGSEAKWKSNRVLCDKLSLQRWRVWRGPGHTAAERFCLPRTLWPAWCLSEVHGNDHVNQLTALPVTKRGSRMAHRMSLVYKLGGLCILYTMFFISIILDNTSTYKVYCKTVCWGLEGQLIS